MLFSQIWGFFNLIIRADISLFSNQFGCFLSSYKWIIIKCLQQSKPANQNICYLSAGTGISSKTEFLLLTGWYFHSCFFPSLKREQRFLGFSYRKRFDDEELDLEWSQSRIYFLSLLPASQLLSRADMQAFGFNERAHHSSGTEVVTWPSHSCHAGGFSFQGRLQAARQKISKWKTWLMPAIHSSQLAHPSSPHAHSCSIGKRKC